MQSYGGFQLVPTFFLFFASGCCDTHRLFVTYSGKVVIFVAKYLFIDVRKVKNSPGILGESRGLLLLVVDEKNMSQKQLASEIGVSPSRISDYVSDRAEPTLKIARLLCMTLGITPASMLGY